MAQVVVEGKASRVFYDGKGLEVVEEFTVKGREVSKRWTAWFGEPHGIQEGSNVKVAGLHSDEINSWTDRESGEAKQSVKRSINQARVLESAPAEPWAPTGEPDEDPYNSEAPF